MNHDNELTQAIENKKDEILANISNPAKVEALEKELYKLCRAAQRQRNISWLKRLNPDAAAKAQMMTYSGNEAGASDAIREATLWHQETLLLWRATGEAVKALNTPNPKLEKRHVIGHWNGSEVELVPQPHSTVRLLCRGILSPEIARQGRDHTRISSAFVKGDWKLFDNARRIFDDWLAAVCAPVAASRWRHQGNGWGKRY